MSVALYGFMIAVALVLRLAPQSPAGRLLNRHLVERPLSVLGRMQRHHVIALLIIIGLLAGSGEMIVAMGGMDVAMIYAIDLSIYIDGLLATLALASLARTRSGFALMRSALFSRQRRAFGRRRVRQPRKPGHRSSANDDEHPAVRPLAA
jgi:hypothetical protein